MSWSMRSIRVLIPLVLACGPISTATTMAQSFGSPGGGFGSAGAVSGSVGGTSGLGGFGSPRTSGAWQGSATVIPEAGGGFSQYDHRGRSSYLGPTEGGRLRHPDGSTSSVLDIGDDGAAVTGRTGVGFVHPHSELRMQDRP